MNRKWHTELLGPHHYKGLPVYIDSSLVVSKERTLSRWERVRERLEDWFERHGIRYPFRRVTRYEMKPDKRVYLFYQHGYAMHPQIWADLRAKAIEQAKSEGTGNA